MVVAVFNSILWFILFLIGHVVIFQLKPSINRASTLKMCLKISLLGNILTLYLLWYLPLSLPDYCYEGSLLLGILWGCLIILGCFVLYTPFYYTVATSLSVQTMLLLAKNGGAMDITSLEETFTKKEFIQKRLNLMINNGLIYSDSYRYFATPKGVFTAKLFLYCKSLWRLGSGG